MIDEKAPYLVVTYNVALLDETVQTFNWLDREKWAITEAVYFETEISNETYESAHLILDVLNGKVRKSNLNNVTDQELIEHYFKIYDKNIVELVKTYFKKYPEAWQNLLAVAKTAVEDLDRIK